MAKPSKFLRGDTWWGRIPRGKGVPVLRTSLGTSDAAEAERRLQEKARQAWFRAETGIDIAGTRARQSMTLDQAFARYWLEHVVPNALPSSGLIKRYSERALAYFGKALLLADLDVAKILGYKAWLKTDQYRLGAPRKRRDQDGLGPYQINAHLNHLRTVVNRARKLWQVAAPERPSAAARVLEDEPQEPPSTLTRDESADVAAIMAEVDGETAELLPIFRFCQVSALRKMNAMTLTKPQVDRENRVVTVYQKSKRKGGKLHRIPYGAGSAIEQIIEAVWNDHPTHLFTYVCRKNWTQDGTVRRAGQRYPFNRTILQRRWDAVRCLAGTQVDWHPATRAFAVTHTIAIHGEAVAQKLAGHANRAMTAHYNRTGDEVLRAAMASLETPPETPAPVPRKAKLRVVA